MEFKPEKQELYGELLGSKPDAIFVWAGGAYKTTSGRYKLPSYSQPDWTGWITGGKARAIAAAELAKNFPEARIVTTTSFLNPEEPNPEEPTQASVAAGELKRRGVPGERILLEEKSVSTMTEIVEMIKLAAQHNWTRIVVLTNDYHLPRTQEMFTRKEVLIPKGKDPAFHQALSRFRQAGGQVNFVSCESILEHRSPRYKRLIAEVKQTAAYKRRVEAEERGLEDLRRGRYRIK